MKTAQPLVQQLVPTPDPVECCERLEGLPYRLFLDSAVRATPLGRYSFVAADPVAVVRSKGGRTEIVEWSGRFSASEGRGQVSGLPYAAPTSRIVTGDALQAARTLLAPHAADPVAELPPFQGGAAGYLAYDWGGTLERVPAARYDDLALPDVVLGIYDWVLAWDHAAGRAWLISTGLPETRPERRLARAAERAALVHARLKATATGSAENAREEPLTSSHRAAGAGWRADSCGAAPSFAVEVESPPGLRSSFTHRGYLDAVSRVREYIVAGDIFQANLSQRFDAPLTEPPWAFYHRLRSRNAAPFAAYLDFPEAVVLSASPERFLRVDVDGHVETRPIKGTRPRGLGPEHDAALGLVLTESAKDRAENLMIVDLMRNDLSRVCAPGTVRVAELFALEHYATVQHLVSTVIGDLAPGRDALDLIRAAFPGGSITGAPKVRAMEIIAELEPSQRGVYCGAVGYWSVTGALDTSIAIRTAVASDGRVSFNAGGGIVFDSDPEQEYRETLDKARGIIDALAGSV